ncbi:glycosyltransferase family 9 protein [Siccirubricoccus sp. KC 17139]|uniref:Glycosyltransferase family 9 protein n=1 Tax=Siccirubricoccus soli TaxID=2899147 RepID=A0ABT1D4Q7_9PROT|nr:glycosyltransferase family 9 protein [Siccirubricoccus soli]MCO6416913.1 glycosyltransferase family 9 protein [Siccirubricoccus soli]MCP2683048.1 glycosyltransferase family 9 protein [Siccirubricoccus soli]
MTRILVIKLAALGDVVQAFGPFAAIRAHHPGAEITLLTTPPYAALLRDSPWFDRIWADGRPSWSDLPAVVRLARRLRGAGFARVYDLQTSARSSRYRWFVGRRAEWSGIASGASHPHANPARDSMHTLERQREQLEMAGIQDFPPPDLSWLEADLSGFALPERFCLLVPGASPLRPGKRWPAERFGALAAGLDLPSVIIGAGAEAKLAAAIRAAAPGAIDLTGRTSFAAIGALARRAEFAVGNDTGPSHLIAATGCPTLTLFGPDSDPALCAPRGRAVAVLRHAPLAGLEVAAVRQALAALRVG